MINQKSVQLGSVRSVIRELFEYGKARKAQIGEENVFDFSLGNPSVAPPAEVENALVDILTHGDPVAVHGYTSAQGDASVRAAVADYINANFSVGIGADNIYMTCGAAASLCIILNALLNEGDEVITIAPYFPEYKVFTEHARGKLVPVQGSEGTFQPDIAAIKGAITPHTKAVLINSPNNPSGVVYTEESIKQLCKVLQECKDNGQTIYLISDEPYRELVFGGVKVPYIMNYYADSIVCYSFSKSLSLPGERIGYIAVNPAMCNAGEVYAAICGAGRALGYVCAPSLFQLIIPRVIGKTSDISVYERNRDVLSAALQSYGYEVVKPDGAFYLFVKSLEPDSDAFAERAKEHELLIVSAKSFGVEGYVRISYCVSPDMIARSLPAFKALAESYGK